MNVLYLWISLGVSFMLFIYPYAIYPSLLFVINLFTKDRPKQTVHTTTVDKRISVIIPTYNESQCITDRLNSLESQNYANYEIIVVDSASDDGTADILKEYYKNLDKARQRNIVIKFQDSRKGKANAINYALEYATGEIIVISDANASFKDNLLQVVNEFYGPEPIKTILTGTFFKTDPNGKADEGNHSIYWKYENFTKDIESRISSSVAAVGELIVFQKHWNLRFPENCISEDLCFALESIKAGFRIHFNKNLLVWEPNPVSFQDDLTQKGKNVQGTLEAIVKNRFILNPKYGVYGMFIFPSHKIMPLYMPYFLLVFIFSIHLLAYELNLLTSLLVAELVVYLILLLFRNRFPFSSLSYLLFIQIAILYGTWNFFTKPKSRGLWKKSTTNRFLVHEIK